MALLARIKTWVSTEDVTYSDLNAEFDNILDNLKPLYIDDYSANTSQMQTTEDPGEVGTESKPTNLQGEITRLRHIIAEITGEDQWYESPTSSLLGLSNAIGTGLTRNRIVSGRVRSAGTNTQPIFLVPNGSAATVTVKGTTTNFIYYVNGTEYTISSDVNLTGLTAAPSSNNTCLVDDAQAADDEYTKTTGENGTIIPVDTMGTEIQALVGKFAAFKLDGVGTEYFIGFVESTTAISKCFRGYFFDSSDAPVARTGYSNNDTITLMKLTWVFAKTDGTLTATYNNPVWSKDEPSSPAVGDYWYDLANEKWKIYGVGSYSDANAHLIGVCFQNTSNCIGARSFEVFAAYDDFNSAELFYESATQVKTRSPGAIVNVYGSTIKADRGLRTWDITLDRDSGVSETSSTYYYAYLTNFGDVVISDVKPYDRREDLRGFYHPYASWRCLGSFYNNGSSNIDSAQVNSYYTKGGGLALKDAAASLHVEVLDKVIRLSGASATEYLPPAAKARGQELVFIHGGTSLSQVYTLDGFGSETIDGAATAALHTNGQVLKIMSDGSNWIVTGSKTTTGWNDFPSLVAGTLITGTGGDPSYGTVATHYARWKRVSNCAEILWFYRQSTAGTAGTGMYLFNLVSGLTIDTNVVTVNTGTTHTSASSDSAIGTFYLHFSNTIVGTGPVVAYSTTQLKAFIGLSSTSASANSGIWGVSTWDFNDAALAYGIRATLPIANWIP